MPASVLAPGTSEQLRSMAPSTSAAAGEERSAAAQPQPDALGSLLATIQQRLQCHDSPTCREDTASEAGRPPARQQLGSDQLEQAAINFPLPHLPGWLAAEQSGGAASTSEASLNHADSQEAAPCVSADPASPGPDAAAASEPAQAVSAMAASSAEQPVASSQAVSCLAATAPSKQPSQPLLLSLSTTQRSTQQQHELDMGITAEQSAESVQPIMPAADLGLDLEGMSLPASAAQSACTSPRQLTSHDRTSHANHTQPEAAAAEAEAAELAAEPSAVSIQPVAQLSDLHLDLHDVHSPAAIPASAGQPLLQQPVSRHLLQAGKALPWLSPSPSAVSLASWDSQAEAQHDLVPEPGAQHQQQAASLSPPASIPASPFSMSMPAAQMLPAEAAARHLLLPGQALPWQVSRTPSAVSLASAAGAYEDRAMQQQQALPALQLQEHSSAMPQQQQQQTTADDS